MHKIYAAYDREDAESCSLSYEDGKMLNRQTAYNRKLIEHASECGCFHCGEVFDPSEITKWISESDGDDTALCPYCGEDAVIVGTDAKPLAISTLAMLYEKWFDSEWIDRRKQAVYVPTFTFDSFFETGIPFKVQTSENILCLDTISTQPQRLFGEIDAEDDPFRNLGKPYDPEHEIAGGTFFVKAALRPGKLFYFAFIDQEGSRYYAEVMTRKDQANLYALATTYGSALKAIVMQPYADPRLIIDWTEIH